MGFLTVLHIIVALVLVLLVLVQDSKGAMGGTFGGGGGGSSSLFGASGAENVLSKLTKGVVVVFAISCILLTRFSANNKESVLDAEGTRATIPAAPASQDTPPSTNSEDTSTSQ